MKCMSPFIMYYERSVICNYAFFTPELVTIPVKASARPKKFFWIQACGNVGLDIPIDLYNKIWHPDMGNKALLTKILVAGKHWPVDPTSELLKFLQSPASSSRCRWWEICDLLDKRCPVLFIHPYLNKPLTLLSRVSLSVSSSSFIS